MTDLGSTLMIFGLLILTFLYVSHNRQRRLALQDARQKRQHLIELANLQKEILNKKIGS